MLVPALVAAYWITGKNTRLETFVFGNECTTTKDMREERVHAELEPK